MIELYYLYHRHASPEYGVEEEQVNRIGVYSSELNARMAIERLRPLPGFSKYPDGFELFKGELDKDGLDGACYFHSYSCDIMNMPIAKDGEYVRDMRKIFYLYHTYSYPKPDPYGDEQKLIGIYSTKLNANIAKHRLLGKPGFSKHLKAFRILVGRLDRDGWETGFISTQEMLDSLED